MKKSIAVLLATFVFIISLSLVSAASFSLGDFLDSLDESTMVLGSLFIIIFAISNFALSRFFKNSSGNPDTKISGVVAFVVSALSIYGINKYGWDYEGFFFSVGLSSELLYIIAPIVLLLGTGYLFYKLKTNALFIIGGLLVIVGWMEWVYEKNTVIIIGATIVSLGILIWIFDPIRRWSRNKKKDIEDIPRYSEINRRNKQYRERKKQQEINRAHEEAIREDRRRDEERGPGNK